MGGYSAVQSYHSTFPHVSVTSELQHKEIAAFEKYINAEVELSAAK